jgi:hypothetical protein
MCIANNNILKIYRNIMKLLYWIIVLFIISFGILSQCSIREGFSSNYNSCIAKGYTKSFCVQTPTSAYGPSSCLCEDGKLGRIIPGFGGQCVCL